MYYHFGIFTLLIVLVNNTSYIVAHERQMPLESLNSLKLIKGTSLPYLILIMHYLSTLRPIPILHPCNVSWTAFLKRK